MLFLIPLEKGYNPNEARDPAGKWAKSGGTGAKPAKEKSYGERMADKFFGADEWDDGEDSFDFNKWSKRNTVSPTEAYQHPSMGRHANKPTPVEPVRKKDSVDDFSDSYTRSYTPERAELHKSIIEKLSKPQGGPLSQLYEDFDESQPVAVIMVGGPAAGKTTYVHNQLLPNHRLQLVGSDEVKPFLPGYKPDDPGYVHRESVHVAMEHMHKCIRDGDSFVFDGTGLDTWGIKEAMNKARKNGFQVAVHFVKTPVEVALKRLENRERKVPENLVRSKHTEVAWAFSQLAPHADHVVEFDNSGDTLMEGKNG